MAASTRCKFSTFFVIFTVIILVFETGSFTQLEDSTISRNKHVYLIRHGQATHNIATHCNERDPKLTELGIQQAKNIKIPADPDLIVISPLTRTLQTAYYAFPNLRHRFLLHVNLQEVHAGNLPCDTGREKEALKSEFHDLPENLFDDLFAGWYNPRETISQRLSSFEDWLASRSEEVIFIVAHHGVFREWFGLDLKNGGVAKLIIDGDDAQIVMQ